jgi:hypothetical protein
MLPVPVREALLHAGMSSPRAFVDTGDAAGLAAQLSAELGKTVTADDVKSWQKAVEDALDVPLPSEQFDHALIET